MQERRSRQRDDGIAGAIHAAWTRFGKSDATTAWGDHDTSSQPLDDWRGVSAAFVKWRGGAMTLCRKRLGVRSKWNKSDKKTGQFSKAGNCPYLLGYKNIINFNFLRKRYEHAMMSAKQDFTHETEKICDSAKRWLRVIWGCKTASEDAQRWRKHLKEVLLIFDKCIIAISSTKPMQER